MRLLLSVAKEMERRVYGSEEPIIIQGAVGDCFYIVERGAAVVTNSEGVEARPAAPPRCCLRTSPPRLGRAPSIAQLTPPRAAVRRAGGRLFRGARLDGAPSARRALYPPPAARRALSPQLRGPPRGPSPRPRWRTAAVRPT